MNRNVRPQPSRLHAALLLALLSLPLLALPLAAQAQSGITDLGTLGGRSSAAYGVSADGSVVVGASSTAGNAAGQFFPAVHAFRWTQASSTMTDLGTLGGTNSAASGVSADGSVVVGGSADTVGNTAFRAFRWTSGGGMVDLGTLGGTFSSASGVSADGSDRKSVV